MKARPPASIIMENLAKGDLGIGLALVREIVLLHGGKVEAHSEGLGKGARFSVWLPLLDRETSAGDSASACPTQSMAGLRILLVDDVEEVVLAFQSLLELQGAEVSVATSGKQALAILEDRCVVDELGRRYARPGEPILIELKVHGFS